MNYIRSDQFDRGNGDVAQIAVRKECFGKSGDSFLSGGGGRERRGEKPLVSRTGDAFRRARAWFSFARIDRHGGRSPLRKLSWPFFVFNLPIFYFPVHCSRGLIRLYWRRLIKILLSVSVLTGVVYYNGETDIGGAVIYEWTDIVL